MKTQVSKDDAVVNSKAGNFVDKKNVWMLLRLCRTNHVIDLCDEEEHESDRKRKMHNEDCGVEAKILRQQLHAMKTAKLKV
jgi:hypothetical protein